MRRVRGRLLHIATHTYGVIALWWKRLIYESEVNYSKPRLLAHFSENWFTSHFSTRSTRVVVFAPLLSE